MIGHVVSHYRLLDKLGEGGMGVVYRAEDQTLGRQVVVKLLSSQLVSDPRARRRFVREAKAAAALDHPGICTVYEAGEADGHLFIAMALLEGETLRKRLASGALSIDESLDVATQVASALAAAHAKGIVHRDIKPENVMLVSGGQAKVLDFGLALLADASQLTRTGTVVGTVAYMSPEQLWGEVVDERTDVWALGVVLYEMLAGVAPFRAPQEPALKYLIVNQAPEPLRSLRTDISPELEWVVTRCLEKKASDRYARVTDVLADLERVDHAPATENVAVEPVLRPAPRASVTISPVQILGERYRVERLLGRGGMGEVWLAFDLKLGVEVALKFLLPELGADPERVALLRREVRSARNVASPHVCRVYDLVEIDGQEVVSMEYVDGTTLQDLLAERSPLETLEARRLATQMLSGLQDIHGAGLIHRDLKPSNVMITRSGRAVVMDFGLAKAVSESQPVSMAGTPAYMAPEQMRGETIDARADLYAAGMILAEMVAPGGVRDASARRQLWDALRHDPPKAPEGPWEATIRRAVAINRGERFNSAAEMARALGELGPRTAILDETSPYPGLSSFTGAQARFFFGREMDVESVWRRLNRLSLSALIGPSGVGKSSFLRAGVMASRPDGWNIAITTPGNNPFNSLGQSLLSEFAGQSDAQDLFRLNEIDRSIPLLNKWRQRGKQALLIVDQFEELFTLNPPDVQARFAELLGRLSVEADIHVLVSMRDDFFFLCQQYPSLRPLFTEPTPLGPLSAQALRRAIVEPARLCGFTFEDDALVDEIMKDVEGERGALPLVAFAAAKLWDLRDCEHGVITRRSYEEIGQVGGALAQHAEATLERIGHEREDVVREIFRNLATAQHTRVVREREELLSVFEDRTAAEYVLNALIDARLLTSFEITEGRKGSTERHRIEVVHESLLTSWPRLVRWQTQDTEGAQLRDQLRQAAQLWKERNESDDLLWTGTAYKEFELWRERYPGGLTETENAFANAMQARARRRRRRRRIALASSFVFLLVVIGVIGASWRKENVARRASEASKLLALGRAALDADPGEALAYVIASLERSDQPSTRHFAIEALSRVPAAAVIAARPEAPIGSPVHIEFSPDGQWLVAGGSSGVHVFPRDGTSPVTLSGSVAPNVMMQRPQFAADSDHIVFNSNDDPTIVRIWSISQGREVRSFPMEGVTLPLVRGGRLFLITDLGGPESIGTVIYPAAATERTGTWTRTIVRSWAFDEKEPTILARWNAGGITDLDIDRDGRWIAYPKGRGVYLCSLDELASGHARLVGEHANEAGRVRFDPAGERLASSDGSTGEIRIWALSDKSRAPLRVVVGGGDPLCGLWFSPSGEKLAVGYAIPDKDVRLWDLTGPRDADPVVLQRRVKSLFPAVAFDPQEQWIAVTYLLDLALWPLTHPAPFVLRGTGGFGARVVQFSPDGESLAAAFYQGGIRIWSLKGEPTRDLWKPESGLECLWYDPLGRFIIAGTRGDGAFRVSLPDGQAQQLLGGPPGGWFFYVVVSPDGRWAAGLEGGANNVARLRVWDLESGTSFVLENSTNNYSFAFTEDGRLWAMGYSSGEIRAWNLRDGSSEVMARAAAGSFMNITPDGRLVLTLTATDTLSRDTSPYLLTMHDLENHTARAITTHGNKVVYPEPDRGGTILVTTESSGTVRVGPISGEEPHLLQAKTGYITNAQISPDRKWIAGGDNMEPVVYLWRMPEGKPFHTLPRDEFLGRLRLLTCLQVVPDRTAASGYRISPVPYAGWEKAPTW